MVQLLRIFGLLGIVFAATFASPTPSQSQPAGELCLQSSSHTQFSSDQNSIRNVFLNEENKDEQRENDNVRIRPIHCFIGANLYLTSRQNVSNHFNLQYHTHKTLVPLYIKGQAFLC